MLAIAKHTANRCIHLKTLLLILMVSISTLSNGQENKIETYGKTFNMGVGPGYFSASILPAPFFAINYEFDILNNLTLSPFVSFASYKSEASIIASRYYYHRATILPFGIKATYYLDNLLKIPNKWDFYIGCSVGYTYIRKAWDFGYPGIIGGIPGLREEYVHAHVGAEYHVSKKAGLFVDVSTGVAVVGVSIHRYE
jgi:hypothetical protein